MTTDNSQIAFEHLNLFYFNHVSALGAKAGEKKFVSSPGREKESTFCVQNMECVVYFSDAGLYDSSEHSI